MGCFCGSAGKESACNVGDLGSIPGLGRSPGEGKGYPFQYSGLENSMNYIVYRVTKSQTQLSDFHFTSHSLWDLSSPTKPKSTAVKAQSLNHLTPGNWGSQVVLVVKNPPASAGDIRDAGLIPGLERSPREGQGKPSPVFLLWEPHGEKSLVGYSPWGHKESDRAEVT